MGVDRSERFVYRKMPYFTCVMALAFGLIWARVAFHFSMESAVSGYEAWVAVLAGLGALLVILVASALLVDKKWVRLLLIPIVGCIILAVFIMAVFFREFEFWLAVLLAVVSLLFAFASAALFLGRTWAPLLVSVMLGALMVTVVAWMVFFAIDSVELGEAFDLVAIVGAALVPLSGLVALIVAVHSRSLGGVQPRRIGDGKSQSLTPPPLGRDDVH